jgi:23S rRNA (adenine2503-C2)-methyltransferase
VNNSDANIRSAKLDIKALSEAQIRKQLHVWGEPKFRASQIHHWLYARSAMDFDSMQNLSKSLRQKLTDHFFISSFQDTSQHNLQPGKAELSTRKFLFKLQDDQHIESVLIPSTSDNRLTVCVSSQVGCSLSCQFCATGKMGFSRNLSVGEIVNQVDFINNWTLTNVQSPVTNVVFMGMGEPLLNLDRCLEAIDILSHPDYKFKIPKRRITLSTIGLIHGIEELTRWRVKFKLAVSLHSGDQEQRQELIPGSGQESLKDLKKALMAFNAANRHPITIEYVLLKDINDNEKAAQALKRFAKGLSCKINLIDFNFVRGSEFQKTQEQTKQKFIRLLLDDKFRVTARKSRGNEKQAACGQLATQAHKSVKIASKRKLPI